MSTHAPPPRRRLRLPALLVSLASMAAVGLVGCGGSSSGEPRGFQEIYDLGALEYLGEIPPSSRVEDGRWIRYGFDPAGPARCMDGSPFRTDLRPGATDDLLVILFGGGACVPDGLCVNNPSALPAGNWMDFFELMSVNVGGRPLSDWSLAVLAYCDGSLMAGDIDLDRDGDGTPDRFHRGLANLTAGLEVAAAEFPTPSRIVIAGASGGAYSTIPAVLGARAVWPDPPLDVINDAGVGLGRPGDPAWIENVLAGWNISSLIPPSCADCTGDGHITSLLDWQLERDPGLRIAALSSYEDFVIGDVFIGIDGGSFRGAVSSEMAELAAAHPGRFGSFLYDGSGHTLMYLGLGGTTAGGVTGKAWISEMLNGGPWTSAAD